MTIPCFGLSRSHLKNTMQARLCDLVAQRAVAQGIFEMASRAGVCRRVALACVFLIASVSVGCAVTTSRDPKFIDDIRPIPPALKIVSYTIQRRDLREALTKITENPIRLVPVFQSVSTTESYEYRIFDINQFGVYALLGLENSDILVAANRYLIKNPGQFPAFVQLLANENEATIEIRRGGEARLLKYAFVPAVSGVARRTNR